MFSKNENVDFLERYRHFISPPQDDHECSKWKNTKMHLTLKKPMIFEILKFATIVVIQGGWYKTSIFLEKIDIFNFRKHLKTAVFFTFFSQSKNWRVVHTRRWPHPLKWDVPNNEKTTKFWKIDFIFALIYRHLIYRCYGCLNVRLKWAELLLIDTSET